MVVIYTDIDAPADKKFTDQYVRAVTDNILMPGELMQTVPLRSRRTWHSLKQLPSDSFPTGNTETLTFGGTGDRMLPGTPGTLDGTFDGVLGSFTCTSGRHGVHAH